MEEVIPVQITIYYRKDDEWLIELLKTRAYAERKSVSQMVLTALEWYFSQQAKAQAQGGRGPAQAQAGAEAQAEAEVEAKGGAEGRTRGKPTSRAKGRRRGRSVN